jgi:hypothetical protein
VTIRASRKNKSFEDVAGPRERRIVPIVNDIVVLASAVIGALLGGYFLLRQQRNQRCDEMRAAARAVLSEMLDNAREAAFAQGLVMPPLPFTASDRFSRATWSEQLPLVAQLLNWQALLKVRRAYNSGSTVFRLVESGIKSSADQANTRRITTELKDLLVGVAQEFEESLKLFPLGLLLNGEERTDFDSELVKLRDEIESGEKVIAARRK